MIRAADHNAGQGLPKFPGRQGHGLQFKIFGILLQLEQIKPILPKNSKTQIRFVDMQCQIQASAGKIGVFFRTDFDISFRSMCTSFSF